MASSVKQLDRSGWSEEALQRAAKHAAEQAAFKAFKAAKAAHPLADVLEGVTAASRDLSDAPRWKAVGRDFRNGHREFVVMREIPNVERDLERFIERDVRAKAPRGEGDRESNIERAVRRAKRDVRHKCKAMLVNSLWTLTYKANLQDRDIALAHFDRFRRRVVALFGEWRYIAVMQQQKRGAWHFHLATHALPVRIVQGGVKVRSWDVMRRIWRDCAGEYGGNFDEAKRTSRWGTKKPIKAAGAIASYIAGYVAKDMHESELDKKRYSASKGIEVPEAYRALWAGDVAMIELIELAYAFVGDNITRSWFDQTRGVFFIESDDTRSG